MPVDLFHPVDEHEPMLAAQCQECGRNVVVHEIETTAETTSDGFDTRYQCPCCKSEIRDVKARIV